ncbi:MAG: hypothetical protein A3F09_04610 [Chlamydiae bacterium RIFCSPHIGHO2_12_FULL_49_11]|nr:MAG: hypothetical protein A3F09_04610 [Chlamydiae bacterium RIFCSPHIGHO2_12_FULL_49_11]
MRKGLFSLLLHASLFCFYVESPYGPALIQKGVWSDFNTFFTVQPAFVFDTVFNRKLQAGGGNSTVSFHETSEMADIAFTFLHRFSAYVMTGGAKTDLSLQSPGNNYLELFSNWAIPWVVGGKAIILDWHNFLLSLDGKYLQQNFKMKTLLTDGMLASFVQAPKFSLTDYQIGVLVGYTTALLTPFIGFYYENVSAALSRLPASYYTLSDFDSASSVSFINTPRMGLVIGADISPHDLFALSFQVRMITETALALTLTFGF